MARDSPEDAERIILRSWGAVIRRHRQWRSLSRRELATKAGISPVFLGEIERGEKDPSTHSLCLIAGALDAPLAELYLRVAVRLESRPPEAESEQIALPLTMRSAEDGSLNGVSLAKDDTAFDLYRIARSLRTDQQVSLLVLATSLSAGAKKD